MSSSFSFPPPPPPPSKAPAPDRALENAPYQRGGYSGSQGGRGGRGDRGGRGRGRGNNHGGSQRGGYKSNQRNSNAENLCSNGGGNFNAQTQIRGQPQPQRYSQGHSAPNSYPSPSTQYNQPAIPQTSYLNPAFLPFSATSQLQWNPPAQTSVTPAAYAQALSSLMASHAQAQSTNTTAPNILYNNPSSDNQVPGIYASSTSSPKPKRKRGSSNPYEGSHASPNSTRNSLQQRPPKAKVDVAPAVPSFGFALPTVSQQSSSPADAAENSSRRKRKFNQLGLTPRSEERENSGDEEVDEEAAFQSAVEGLVVTYKGHTSALNSPSDIAAWIQERKKRFPTKARIEEKKKEEEIEKAHKQEMHRRVKEQAVANKKERSDSRPNRIQMTKNLSLDNEDEHQKKVLEKQLKKAEKLRKMLQRSEEKAAKAADALAQAHPFYKPTSPSAGGVQGVDDEPADMQSTMRSDEQVHPVTTVKATNLNEERQILEDESRKSEDMHQRVNLGLDYDSNTSGSETGVESDDSSSTSTSDSESEPDLSSSDINDSDSAPKAESSKLKKPVRIPPPKAKAQLQRTEASICSAYKKTGKCRYGRHCKFSHSLGQAGQEQKTRKRLYDRLVEQEQREADMLALQAIKHLGKNGFLA
ncbi:hypothetical protein AOQ84DRAFT_68967 [Glonium stellatum]|uniref:C3H1-type domain-containing protein n=1 Tax=Glonium stellatum TaxID=574774 RepID=A0A8E2JRL3_9PEZI|nr:hypothetical protein AOQ84DRAFT_68967 [Glonium stellatum]